MEIRVLRYFMEAAREENMTRAAAHLHVTQPTLSRQLKGLEEELGQKLFIRSNYSIHLTEEGKILYKRAEDILDMVDKTAAEFDAMNQAEGGDVYIGCAESEGISHVARAANSLRKRYPNIYFHLYSGNAQRVTEQLDQGLLDFAVVVQNVDVSKYAHLSIPFEDTWGLIMRRDNPLSSKQFIELSDLLEIPLILSRQGITNEMPDWFQKNREKLNVVATYDLLFNASVFVREGIGCALSFDKLVNTDSDDVLCFRPIDPPVKSPMRIIWKLNQIFSRPAELFFQELKTQLKAEAAEGDDNEVSQ